MSDVRLVMFGNPGNWEWVEGREFIRACISCRVVYPPSLSERLCPRHGPTVLIPVACLHWGAQGAEGPREGPVERPSRKASAHLLWINPEGLKE